MKKIGKLISYLEDYIFGKTTGGILFIASLGLFIYYLFCNSSKEISASFLAAAGTFLAAFLTLKVAKSAQETSKEAMRVSQKLVDLETMKEGPVVYVMPNDLIPSGSQRNLVLRNYGDTAAINISSDLLKIPHNHPLFSHVNIPGSPVIELNCEIIDLDQLPPDDQKREYVIMYENFFGKKFVTKFTIMEEDGNKGNTVVQRRTSVYRIISQKVALFKED